MAFIDGVGAAFFCLLKFEKSKKLGSDFSSGSDGVSDSVGRLNFKSRGISVVSASARAAWSAQVFRKSQFGYRRGELFPVHSDQW